VFNHHIGYLRKHVREVAERLKPAMIAVMPYAKYLEYGGKHPPRPHLEPAIHETAEAVIDYVRANLADVMRRCVQHDLSENEMEWNMANVFKDALDTIVVPAAQSLPRCPFLTGYHWRNIRGYGQMPDLDQLVQEGHMLAAERLAYLRSMSAAGGSRGA
jgi:hypothetical protein